MAGQRACLGSHAFLHVAVAAQTDHMLIENLVLIRIETCRRHLCRHGNPNRVADSLTEWPRCAFHPRRLTKFRVPRRFGMQLAETLDLRHRQVVTAHEQPGDRKSTRLNSSHSQISYAVFCLKKKKHHNIASRYTCKDV